MACDKENGVMLESSSSLTVAEFFAARVVDDRGDGDPEAKECSFFDLEDGDDDGMTVFIKDSGDTVSGKSLPLLLLLLLLVSFTKRLVLAR